MSVAHTIISIATRVAFASCVCFTAAAIPAYAAEEAPLIEVKRFVVEGDNPLSAAETQRVLQPYLGPHSTLASLEGAATALQAAIRGRGYSFHRVIVPAQRPTEGELKLRILPFVVERITVTGNKYFSEDNIRRSIPGLQPGRAPNVGLLAQQLSLANEHASKRVTLQIKEGTKPDTVDADLRVVDASPSQFFVGLIGGTRDFDNTLNRNTGYTRVTLGYQNSNLFNRDHTATVAYTTSPEHIDKVKQIGVFYTIPFYGLNTMLTGYYTYSDIDSGSVGLGTQSFDVSGKGEFYGLKATYALPRFGNIVHNVSLAIDQRYFESNVAFAGTPLPASTVGSLPLSFRYSARLEREEAVYAGFAEYVFNLDGGRANDDASYSAARPGAERDWEAYRFGLDATHSLGARWSLAGRLRAQYAHEALIPGEQIGIAGMTAVRGFREREVTGDKGYFVNLEANGPPVWADLSPFAFYDFGARKLVVPVTGASDSDHISSAGLGVRWKWRRADVSVMWAHVLNGVGGGTPRDHDKLHFSAFYRF
jgi:hemolysin activation/secretion protein